MRKKGRRKEERESLKRKRTRMGTVREERSMRVGFILTCSTDSLKWRSDERTRRKEQRRWRRSTKNFNSATSKGMGIARMREMMCVYLFAGFISEPKRKK